MEGVYVPSTIYTKQIIIIIIIGSQFQFIYLIIMSAKLKDNRR